MIPLLIVIGIVVLIVVCSVVGARRGTPMAFEAQDADIERGRAGARYFDGLGSGGDPGT